MEPKRTILHVDMDAFFASVEERDNPELKGKPVVVGAHPEKRGVISAASYEARKFGIHSAMPSRTAAKLCPDAVFLPVDMARYKQASKTVFKIFQEFTPLVEPLSIDEAFLDCSGSKKLFGPGPDIARQIKARIVEETGLTGSVGVATNKFLAKLASDMDKPDGLTVVPDTTPAIRDFLAPLPVGRLWGVGKATREILNKAGIYKIADLQSVQQARLATLVGQHTAVHLQRLAYGDDERPIQTAREEKSISREHTFLEDCDNRETIRSVLLRLVDEVGRNLRRSNLYAGTAHLKLRWRNFDTITRQIQLKVPARDDDTLRQTALKLFDAQELIKPVRLVGFGVSRFDKTRGEQLSLFDSESQTREKRERLSYAVDRIIENYGEESIRRGD